MSDRKTDILVVGCGIAGATAALTAADSGADVILITSAADLDDGNTSYAQGGIVYRGLDDSAELLARDITAA
ncbi:MAG TPA: FAD-dependent oxidoreductase, partial [Kiritimatiellia bacterium]|nr:FAD-dependent oxidoreductase [Kiritimatiellia bacterium]